MQPERRLSKTDLRLLSWRLSLVDDVLIGAHVRLGAVYPHQHRLCRSLRHLRSWVAEARAALAATSSVERDVSGCGDSAAQQCSE
jgi:hypothetical protein